MMKKQHAGFTVCSMFLVATFVLRSVSVIAAEPLLIDHNDVDITALSEAQINRAKATLHIAYGHTSHGSQLTTGMNGLIGFANGGGKGLSLPEGTFAWNDGGVGGALDLHDYAMGGDVGYWPQWYNNTVSYLSDPANADVNVIIWSWCGQVDSKYAAGTLGSEYLYPMSSLETNYPDIVFVYMTGHVDHWDDANNKAANQMIRDYCSTNNKVLYDFADIESYDPDGTFYEFPHDNCDYYSSVGTCLGNWAQAWQASHVENVDWYDCSSAHSEPLNANQKAYAAWALWCALGADLDRDRILDEWEERYGGSDQFQGGTNDWDRDGATDIQEFIADTNPTNPTSIFCVADIVMDNSCSVVFTSSADRVYGLECITDLVTGEWCSVDGQTNKVGSGGSMSLTDSDDPVRCFYRVIVGIP